MKLTLKVFLFLLVAVSIATPIGILFAIIFIGRDADVPRMMFHIINPLIMIIGLVTFGLLIYFLIIKRIKKLSSVMRDVSKGNYDVSLTIKGRDELSILGDEFNVMTKELKANEYLNKEYIKNISHELKTPLSSIKGFAELIAEQDIDPQRVKSYSRIIAAEADRVLTLSAQMLTLSKLQSSNIMKKDDIFSVDEQIREVILLLQNEWQEKNIDFDVDMGHIEITGNKELTRLIWQNLISNAVKFTEQEGSIEVKLYKNDKLHFEIKDNGIGISEEDKPSVFQQFFTADKSKTGKNTGLGLSIVKNIVDKLGGAVTFTSEQGKGSAFRVELNI